MIRPRFPLKSNSIAIAEPGEFVWIDVDSSGRWEEWGDFASRLNGSDFDDAWMFALGDNRFGSREKTGNSHSVTYGS